MKTIIKIVGENAVLDVISEPGDVVLPGDLSVTVPMVLTPNRIDGEIIHTARERAILFEASLKNEIATIEAGAVVSV